MVVPSCCQAVSTAHVWPLTAVCPSLISAFLSSFYLSPHVQEPPAPRPQSTPSARSLMVASVRRRRPHPPDSDHVLPPATATSPTIALDSNLSNEDDEDEEGRLERCKACAVCGKPNGKACVKCAGGAFYCDKDCQR